MRRLRRILLRWLLSSLGLIAGLALAQTTGQSPPQHRSVADVLSTLDRIKPDPQMALNYRALLDKPLPPADAFWFTKRDALLERMDAAENLGDLKVRLAAADAIMTIFRERKDRIREMEFAHSYSGMLREAGKLTEAFKIEEEMVADPATYAHWWMSYHNRRTLQAADLGDLKLALIHYEQAVSEYERVRGYSRQPNTASAFHMVTASVRQLQGRYAEAQASYEEGTAEARRWIRDVRAVAGPARHALPSNRGYGAYIGYTTRYVRFLLDWGRLADAERVAREPLLWALERMGKYSHHSVQAAGLYAEVLSSQGRHGEAEQLSRAALDMAKGIGANDESVYVRNARYALGRALLGQGQARAADSEFVAAQHPFNSLMAIAAVLNGRASEVMEPLRLHAERVQQRVGAAHPLTGEARGVYAMGLAATGAATAAAEFHAAMPGLLAARQQLGEAEEAIQSRIRQWILEAYLKHLGERAANDPTAAEQAFALADLTRSASSQQAVAASAARVGIRDPQLAAAVQQEQALRTELIASFRALQRVSTLSAAQLAQQKEDIGALRARIETVAKAHARWMADIERQFPRYAALINPQPATLEQARAALRPGEVLINILSADDRSLVWAIPHTGPAVFHSSPLGEREMAPLVRQLRDALDVGDAPPARWPRFDTDAAHRLYRELLAPLQATLDGAKVLIVASGGSLASLPPGVLVTRPHALGADRQHLFDRYADVPWLADRVATAQVPSVNALVLIRALAAGDPARTPFVGFADPVFAATATARGSDGSAIRRSFDGRVSEQTVRRNVPVPWTPYSALSALPDTRDEVLAMASALGADPGQSVFLGPRATRQQVLAHDLSRARVVAFATHGLLPGDFPGLTQPALALSAPGGVDVDREPVRAMLTLEDVLQLRMNADWVVLSACNTASGDGLGGEAISGLGRGFFYAGARALLVTHWAVESESARALVSEVFRHYASATPVSRAESLHQAMRQLRAQTARASGGQIAHALAHPLFWAPYALVGDPGP